MKLRSFIYICSLFLLVSCGGGSNSPSGDGSSTNSQTGLPSDLSGLLVLQKYVSYSHYDGVYAIDIKAGNVIRHKSILGYLKGNNYHQKSRYPYAYDRNTITHVNYCNTKYWEQVGTINEKGLVAPRAIAPCGVSPVEEYSFGRIVSAKLSPDKSKVAVVSGNYDDHYVTYIYNAVTLEEIAKYKNYLNAEWFPDGKLLLTNQGGKNGIYVADKNFSTLNRIDNGLINTNIYNPDISPSGKKIVFGMNQDIWAVNLDGSNLVNLVEDEHTLAYPTWSPAGKYIAFLSISDNEFIRKISFFNVATKKKTVLDTKTIFPKDSNNYDNYTPSGPLSWVK